MIHDDGDALDLLTRLFEADGSEVLTAVSGFRAQALLEGDKSIDVVVAPWDLQHQVGGDVYRWSLQRRYDLRDQFVFISAEVMPEFDRLVAGRCLATSLFRPAEIVRIAAAAVRRRWRLEAERDAAVAELDNTKPTLLLADDDPVLLKVMADLLGDGYAVTCADHADAAITELERDDFDAIVADWTMDHNGGADIYRWLRDHKPILADRVVFLTSEETDDTAAIAPNRPRFRKGQDSGALTDVLREIVRQARVDRGTV